MKTSDVLQQFGTASAVAETLGITRSAVSQWGEMVPPASAARLEKLSGGKLVFDPDVYRNRRGRLWSGSSEEQRA